MPMKRIIAYYMHEAERDAAVQYLSSARDAGSYVIGNVNEADVPALVNAGLVVEKVSDAPAEPPAGRPRREGRVGSAGTRARRTPLAASHLVLPPAPVPNIGARVLIYDVRLHRAEDAAAVLDWLDKHRAIATRAGQRKLRVYLPEDSPLVDEIPGLKEVAAFEQFVVDVPTNGGAAQYARVEAANPLR
jgi:hypothetical protein